MASFQSHPVATSNKRNPLRNDLSSVQSPTSIKGNFRMSAILTAARSRPDRSDERTRHLKLKLKEIIMAIDSVSMI